jgi:spore coat protein YutH
VNTVKNVINYYFNLFPENIHQANHRFFFKYNDEKYYLVLFDRPVEQAGPLYELNIEMLKRHLLVHEIILNKDKQILTNINNIPYVLMKVYVNEQSITKLADVNYITTNTRMIYYNKLLDVSDWVNLWSNKIDYIEYQINQLGTKYPNISDSISYFIGLAENAITYVKNTYLDFKINHISDYVVSHRRIKPIDSLFDAYNPLNLVLDLRVRDLSEYIKAGIFCDKDIWGEIEQYFAYNSLTVFEYRLLFGRMLFPSFYFDIYDDILAGKVEEKELFTIINKINKYEDFLKEFYAYIRISANIPPIEWLQDNVDT